MSPTTVPEDDVTLLKRLLADQRAATLEARAELAEFTKPAGKPSVPPDFAKPQPEPAILRLQWERAVKDLERAKVAHARELELAAAELARLSEALRLEREGRLNDASRRKGLHRAKWWGGVIAACVLAAVLASGFFR